MGNGQWETIGAEEEQLWGWGVGVTAMRGWGVDGEVGVDGKGVWGGGGQEGGAKVMDSD